MGGWWPVLLIVSAPFGPAGLALSPPPPPSTASDKMPDFSSGRRSALLDVRPISPWSRFPSRPRFTALGRGSLRFLVASGQSSFQRARPPDAASPQRASAQDGRGSGVIRREAHCPQPRLALNLAQLSGDFS